MTNLSMKNKKEELLSAYFDSLETINEMKQQQKILFIISGLLLIYTLIK